MSLFKGNLKPILGVIALSLMFILSGCLNGLKSPLNNPNEILVEPSSLDTYECVSKNLLSPCPYDLSGGKQTRCYMTPEKDSWLYCGEGWRLYSTQQEQEARGCGDYFCYEDKDYCRLSGLLTNPRVLRSDVCGS